MSIIFTKYSLINKIIKLLLAYCLLPIALKAQTPEPATNNVEQQLENIVENNEDAEIEDDTYLQQMQQYLQTPINLNTADENTLKGLRFLKVFQIQNLISYRKTLGLFINIYELQAIPTWDIDLIQKIKSFVTVSTSNPVISSIKERLKNGEQSILARVSQTFPKSKGYLLDPAVVNNYYPGSPHKLLLRYKYQFKNLLQYGFTAEKDAGEQFFKGKQKQGFDFYSAHFFARDIGKIKSLAIGDFTVNMGQGLTQWQSLAFKKSADVINIKRESAVLRPYNAAGEINFHRGVGVTIKNKNLVTTLFASYKKIDANFVVDTSQNGEDYITSLQTSGYHRTKSETIDKNIQQQIAFGGNMAYKFKKFHLGINAIQYQFKFPLQKNTDPYNLFALAGKSFGNYSIDYSFTHNNFHFFGEAATSQKKYNAFINGVIISTSSIIDMSFLYRNISKGYQSLHTSAFTESTFPSNEKGFYSGISIHPNNMWRLDAYADFYKFPWIKFRVDAPSSGADYLVQLTYKPNKQLEIYTRLHSETKAINVNPNFNTFPNVIAQPKQNWRTQFLLKLNQQFSIRSRVELLWFNKDSNNAEQGFLTYFDVLYKPMLKSFSGNIRLQYFETDSYNSRLYAYENDLLYSFSIPVFYDKGLRYYINANFDINKKISVWVRYANTIYINKNLIGSGLDEINGNTKKEIKLQMLLLL